MLRQRPITRISAKPLPAVASINNSVAADKGLWRNHRQQPSTASKYHRPLLPETTYLERQLERSNDPVKLLEKTITKPGYHPAPITLGHFSDPYYPDSRTLSTTRDILKLMFQYRHPIRVLTNSHLVVKDLDLLSKLTELRLCTVVINLNTLNEQLKTTLETRTSSPNARLKAITRLSDAGIAVGALVAPVIPLINDGEIEGILSEVCEAGAIAADYEYLKMTTDLEHTYRYWLERHFPDQAERIFNLTQVNRSSYAREFANMVDQRFWMACEKLQLNRTGLPALDTTRFRHPV